MQMKVVLDDGAFMPTKAHKEDAGFDLRSRTSDGIMPGSSAFFDTGVHVEIPEGYVGFLKAKSGLNVKYNIVGTGVIDSGYTGTIGVKLYNHGTEPYIVSTGDKIIQMVILPIPEVELTQVAALTEFSETDRGNGGYGSTGK